MRPEPTAMRPGARFRLRNLSLNRVTSQAPSKLFADKAGSVTPLFGIVFATHAADLEKENARRIRTGP